MQKSRNTKGLKPPWKLGCPSPNPGGRPKKNPISDRYAELAETPLPENIRKIMKLGRGATYADALALSQFQAGIKGRTEAAREVREAIEGKASQRVHISGPTSAPLTIQGTEYVIAIRRALGFNVEEEARQTIPAESEADDHCLDTGEDGGTP